MFEGPLLHVGLLVLGEAQEAEDTVLEGGNFGIRTELLIVGMERPWKAIAHTYSFTHSLKLGLANQVGKIYI